MAGFAYVFHRGETYHTKIEQVLSRFAQQQVSIGKISTDWEKGALRFILKDIQINNQITGEQYGHFSHIAGKVNLWSILVFWPNFKEFVVESPKLSFSSLEDGSFLFLGKVYRPSKSQQRRSFLALTWLLSQETADIHNGEFIWNHREGKKTQIKQFSVQYRHQNDLRKVFAIAKHDQETLALSAELQGNALFSRSWNADMKLQSGSDIDHMNKNNFYLKVDNGQGSLHSDHFRVERLAEIANIVGRGSQLERWLSDSKLSGTLQDIKLKFSGALINLDSWEFSAKGRDLACLSTGTLPGLGNARAIFRMNQSNGVFAFSVKDTQFVWPKHFVEPIQVDDFSAKVTMLKEAEAWRFDVQDISFSNPYAILTNSSAKLTKTHSKPAYLSLGGTLEMASLADAQTFFPRKTGTKFQDWWRNAIKENIAVSGNFSFIGDLVPAPLTSGKADLLANLKTTNVVLDYGWKRNWPKFTADSVEVNLSGGSLFFNAINGKVGTLDAIDPKVEIKNFFQRERSLELNSNLSGSLSAVVDFLQDGPLVRKKLSDQAVKIRKASGNVVGNLQFSMPLRAVRNTELEGHLTILNGAFDVGNLFNVKNIEGDIQYTESSVLAKDINVSTLGGKAVVGIETLSESKPPHLRITATGRQANMKKLDGLLSPQLVSKFSGSTDWQGHLDFSNQGLDIEVVSQLEGVSIDLPEPLSKNIKQKAPFSLVMDTGSKRINTLSLSIADEFDMKLTALDVKGNLLDKGILKVGKLAIEQDNTFSGQGIDIYSHGDINVDDWISTVQDMSKIKAKRTTNRSFLDQLRKIDIQSDNFVLFDKNLGQTAFVAISPDGKKWESTTTGKNVNGTGILQPFESPQKYSFNFQNLFWPAKSDRDIQQDVYEQQQDDQTGSQPSNYPHVLVRAENFKMADQRFGRLFFKAKPVNNEWLFEKLDIESPSLKIVGAGAWRLDQNQQGFTQLNLNLKSKEGGQALSEFGFGGFLEKGQASIELDLNWKGAPAKFSLAKLNGQYNLDISKGSFPKIQADQARIFGLLNVNALSRRLRLDFGDLFGQGLLFDEMKSNGLINNGDVVLDKFYIFSPSVYVEALGEVDLVQENYDMQILVSPQLGGNVALLTALSNPAAGAVVWLVDKVFKGKLNKAVVYTYKVDGDWNNPKVVRQTASPSSLSTESN